MNICAIFHAIRFFTAIVSINTTRRASTNCICERRKAVVKNTLSAKLYSIHTSLRAVWNVVDVPAFAVFTGGLFTELLSQVCDSLFRSLWFSRRRVEDLRFGHRVSLNHELAPRRFPFFTSGENRVLRLWRRTRTHSLLDTFVKNYFADAENESLRAAARHISFCCKMFRERIKRGEHARTRGRRARLRHYYYWRSASLRFICLANGFRQWAGRIAMWV